MLRKNLSMILVVTLTWHCWAFATPRAGISMQPEALSEQSVVQSLQALADDASRLRPRIDRSRFEIEALLNRLDLDADRIVTFVSDEIATEIYPGVLRGARGTLISRAGNALDQALLLATLLKKAGFDAVIRKGRLPSSDASALVRGMAAPRTSTPSLWTEPPDEEMGASSGRSDPDSARAKLVRAARTSTDLLSRTLTQANVELGDSSLLTRLESEAEDYFWVDYRDGMSDGWTSAHPAIAEDPKLEESETFADKIPAELTHRVTIEVSVVQKRGSKTEETALVAPIDLIGPELIGSPLTLSLVPDQVLNQDNPPDAEILAAKTRFLLPMVNGSLAPGGKALSIRGLLVPLDSLGMGAAGIFETQAEKTSQAVDALSGLGSKGPNEGSAVAIEALRLRVTFRAPDGTERIEIRDLFNRQRDLSLEEIRAKTPGPELVSALAQTHSFISSTGAYAEGYVIDSLLAQMESLDSLLEASRNLDSESCQTLGCFKEIDWEAPDLGPGLAMLYLGFDGVLSEQKGGIQYRHTPNLVRLSQPILPRSERREYPRVDILSNSRRALLVHNGRLEPAPTDLMLSGVWETGIETDILAKPSSRASASAVPVPELRLYGREDVQSHAASGGIAGAMMRDIDNGYLILSERSLDFENPSAETRWWRIDPASGETLGMNQHGGSVIVEGLLITIGFTLFLLVVSTPVYTYQCWSAGGGSMRACFLCDNPVMFSLWSAASLWVATGLTYSEFEDWSFWEERWEFVTGCTAIID